MIDLSSFKVLFDEELGVNMLYTKSMPYFHTFEIDSALVGLDFVDEKEAEVFFAKVQSNIPKSSKTADELSALQVRQNAERSRNESFGMNSFVKKIIGQSSRNDNVFEISRPTNVKHLQHIGYDPDKGFDVSNIPAEWKSLFIQAGLSDKDLQDQETAQMVIQTIQEHQMAAPPPVSAPPAPAPPPAPGAPAPVVAPPSGRPPVPSRPPPREAPAPAPAPAGSGLLDEIKKGRQLKKLEDQPLPDIGEMKRGEQDDLADKIKKMMDARRQHIKSEPEDEDNNEDW